MPPGYLSGHTSGLTYRYQNWEKQSITTFRLNYSYDPEYISGTSRIENNAIILGSERRDNRHFFSSNLSSTKYIKPLRALIQGRASFHLSNYQSSPGMMTAQNREIFQSYDWSVESIMRGWIEYEIGFSWTIVRFRSISDIGSISWTTSNVDVYGEARIKIADDQLILIAKYNFLKRKLEDSSDFHFFDAELRVKPKKHKIYGSIRLHNILNRSAYVINSVNDLRTISTTYSIIPQYILLIVGHAL